MAACSNAGSTISGSTRRISSSTMARGGGSGGTMNNKGGVSASSNNSEANSSGETSSGGSFSCMTTTSSSSGRSSDGGAATTAAASSSHTVPPMGLRRPGGNGGGNGNGVGKTNKKRFVGVRQRPSGRWVAEIKDTTQKIRLWLGTFDTAEGAARAYDEAAWLLRGANTRTNFVPSTNSSEAPALPSKAARILQSRRNSAHAAKSGNNSAMNGSNRKEQQQQQLPQTVVCVKSEPMSRSEATTPSPVSSPDQPACVPASVMASEADDNNQLNTRNEASVHNYSLAVTKFESENFCSDISKSESCSFESSVDEMCDLEESPAPEFNATSSVSSGATEDHQHPAASQTTVFEGADDAPRRFEIVKQEIPRDYCQSGDSSAIRENRKDNDYCSEPPQESFVDDTDMTSGLAGLDDGNFSSVDSVYTTLFDFSANTGSGLDAGSDYGNFILSSDDDCVSEHMRRMNYERQISAGLYAMNGVQEYLSMSQGGPGMSMSSSFGMSSPSLTLAKGFRRSSSGPFLTASPGVWKTSSTASNGNSSWVTPVNNSSSSASTGNANGESVESPREDALWQSWDLGPICAVASC